MKLKTTILLLLIFICNHIEAQTRYVYSSNKEFSLELPGDVYYDKNVDDSDSDIILYEELYNDDYEADLTVYKGSDYEYLEDLSKELNAMSDDLGYTEVRKFFKSSQNNEVNSEFYIGYSDESESNVIFGIIQNSFSRRLYEFELFCLNIDMTTANKIIRSIVIK